MNPRKPASSPSQQPVKVWDPFIRIFHWSLVLLFATAFLTGEEFRSVHLWAGYAITALVALRILWGFVGTQQARFADFVTPPRVVWDYIVRIFHHTAPRTLGHNPAGGAMIVLLLMMLAALSATGLLLTSGTYADSKPLEETHEFLANATLGLVALHVCGVIVASIEHAENLVRSMISGLKRPL